jgi:hypothetical protein
MHLYYRNTLDWKLECDSKEKKSRIALMNALVPPKMYFLDHAHDYDFLEKEEFSGAFYYAIIVAAIALICIPINLCRHKANSTANYKIVLLGFVASTFLQLAPALFMNNLTYF